MADRIYTVYVPAAQAWLTANIERFRYRRAELVRDWREATWLACREMKLPTGITPVTIHAVCRYVGRRPVRDNMNLAPTLKAVVDGLTPPRTTVRKGKTFRTVGYGLIPDDSDSHVRRITWELKPADARGARIELTITHHMEGP
jgi:hypothetical protein